MRHRDPRRQEYDSTDRVARDTRRERQSDQKNLHRSDGGWETQTYYNEPIDIIYTFGDEEYQHFLLQPFQVTEPQHIYHHLLHISWLYVCSISHE